MEHLQLILSLLTLIFIFNPIKLVHSQPEFTYTNCSITPDTYSLNSPFHQNLKLVLGNLTLASSTSNSTFFNFSFGNQNNAVYGLYLCRGDLNREDCSSCINNVTKEILIDCPNKKETIKWVQQCMLRYANRDIFSKEEEDPRYNWTISTRPNPPENTTLSPPSSSSPGRFNLTTAIYELINKTAFGDYSSKENKKYYSTREDNVTWNPLKVYSLAQCTPDISQLMCQRCLTQAYTGLRGTMQALAYLPSCHLRYDFRKFFGPRNQTDVNSPPPPSKMVPRTSETGGRNKMVIGISSAAAVLLLSIVCFFIWRVNTNPGLKGKKIATESLQYDIDTIKVAVDNFSERNKLGKGGFGDVFKGKLEDGQEIAVKRLLRDPKHGIHEFKTEVLLVTKLQHKNLVRLLGFCVAEDEKLLIYEYLPCSSLDRHLFNPEKRAALDWETRYRIIDGVAKGLLYLHEDSRYKIIHRDLKPANILLDKDMTPKISDFGLAKLFGDDRVQDVSKGIAGTLGYMAPEYLIHGDLSIKSDVYSFGILVLEMVSGRRIIEKNICIAEDKESLLECAWRLWNVKEPLALVDPSLCGNFSDEEATRCIHIGLSCVHIDAKKRPTMASVVSILNSYSNSLPQLPLEGYPNSGDKTRQ